MEIYLEKYKININVQRKNYVFSYEYQYMGENFSGNITIRATKDETWIAEIIKLYIEEKVEQFILDQQAFVLIGD